MIEFVMPSEETRDDVLSFYDEIARDGGSCVGIGGYKDYDAWLDGMRNRRAGKNLPKGYVRENFYLCYKNGVLIGVFSLKFELTEYLLNYGGHIGYAVRPSERKRGIATQILRDGLAIARDNGIYDILCVCDDDNYASEKVIVKNGGVLEDIRFDPDESVFVKRYRIRVSNNK